MGQLNSMDLPEQGSRVKTDTSADKPSKNRWWLWALVHWADERDPESGHTAFVLRRPAVEALQQLGIAPASTAE